MMHGRRKSDSAIVAVKPANNAERSAAEPVEPRAGTKGNAGQQSTRRTQSRISVSKMLARIRQIVAVDTRGGSRMRESCTYGSVRGALSNERPYRDRFARNDEESRYTSRRVKRNIFACVAGQQISDLPDGHTSPSYGGVARMERSAIRGRRESRIALRSIRATMFANVIARSDSSPVVRRMG